MSSNNRSKISKAFVYIYKKLKTNKYFIPFTLFGLTFATYVHNLSPSSYGGDAGDLINAALARGVAHPSGYPIYTMLGILMIKLPINMPAAWKVGLVSSLSSALTVVAFYFLIFELTKSKYLSILSSLTLAFLYTFWLYSEISEVFTLHAFFIVILTYLTVKYVDCKKNLFIYLIAFFSGLSLTNNQSIIVLFPPMALTVIWTSPKIIVDIKTIIKSIFLGFVGLLPYLYIPIAASKDPYYNWGEVKNFENFWYLLARKDYGWTPTTPFDKTITISHLASYYDYLKIYVYPLIPILAILGVFYLIIKKNYKLVFFFLTSYLFFIFFIVYTRAPFNDLLIIATFEKFYIAGFIFLVIFFTYGIQFVQFILFKLLKRKFLRKLLGYIVLATFFIVPISLFLSNFNKTNLSDVHIGDNYAIDILNSLPENSIVLLRGDHEHFNSVYVQKYYGFREDVHLTGRHNGFEALLKSLSLSDEEISEHKLVNKSAIELNTFYAAAISQTKKGNFFTDSKIVPHDVYEEKLGKLKYVPYGLFYKLDFENNFQLPKEEYLTKVEKYTSTYHLDSFKTEKHTRIIENSLMYADIQTAYASAFYKIAKFLSTEYQDHKSSAIYLNKALEIDPLYSPDEEAQQL